MRLSLRVKLPHSGWLPRPYQEPLWDALNAGVKRAICIWHRRAGKDDVMLHWAAKSALTRKVGNYWHMLPEANQARKAIWEAVNPHTGIRRIDEAFPMALRETTREQEMLIRLRPVGKAKSGSTWQVVGSDNYKSLVGSPPVGIVFSEWARADSDAWAYLRPILAENDGWASFITTPFGRNHAHTMFEGSEGDPNWFVQKLTALQTGVFTPEQLEREKQEYIRELGRAVGEAMFAQEYLCNFDSPVLGAYYAEWLQKAEEDGRITNVPFDPTFRVETWWDLGYNDATAIWFVQRAGQSFRVIDYVEESGAGIEYYAKVLAEKAQKGGWLYSDHVWPHDGGHGSIDTGTSRVHVAKGLGFEPKVLPRTDIDDGIQAARSILPRCWFDKDKCARGLKALREYRAEYDDTRKVLRQRPLHNWASNGADAFRYGAMHKPATRKWDTPKETGPRLAIV